LQDARQLGKDARREQEAEVAGDVRCYTS